MNQQNALQLDRKVLVANFNKAAASYNQVSVLQREIADRMFDRLDLVSIRPKPLLILALALGIPLSFYKIDIQRRKSSPLNRQKAYCGNFKNLPQVIQYVRITIKFLWRNNAPI